MINMGGFAGGSAGALIFGLLARDWYTVASLFAAGCNGCGRRAASGLVSTGAAGGPVLTPGKETDGLSRNHDYR
jgi:hypothetical protein